MNNQLRKSLVDATIIQVGDFVSAVLSLNELPFHSLLLWQKQSNLLNILIIDSKH